MHLSFSIQHTSSGSINANLNVFTILFVELLMYNAMVSLPYYVLTIFYEGEVNSIQTDLSTSMSVMFLVSLIGSIFLACLS